MQAAGNSRAGGCDKNLESLPVQQCFCQETNLTLMAKRLYGAGKHFFFCWAKLRCLTIQDMTLMLNKLGSTRKSASSERASKSLPKGDGRKKESERGQK